MPALSSGADRKLGCVDATGRIVDHTTG
jgi:hypothetical protein